MSDEETDPLPEAMPEEQYPRASAGGDPYDIRRKDGKDPWKESFGRQLLSWVFWLAMFYFATAGFIYGLMTDKDGASNPTADLVFMPAEFVRGWSALYTGIIDWQISLFREAEEVAGEE